MANRVEDREEEEERRQTEDLPGAAFLTTRRKFLRRMLWPSLFLVCRWRFSIRCKRFCQVPVPLLCQFLSEPIVIASSIPPLGSSPQLLHLLVEDLTVGVGATVEEFEEAVACEAELEVMVESLVESEGKPLTNDPDTVGELLEA